jgi:hypothetical protein
LYLFSPLTTHLVVAPPSAFSRTLVLSLAVPHPFPDVGSTLGLAGLSEDSYSRLSSSFFRIADRSKFR